MTRPNERIGNYCVVAKINSGTYGSVYTGKHLIFEDEPIVAIKVLHSNLVSQEDQRMFIQEAQFLKKLKHPNILPLLDAGMHEQSLYLKHRICPEWHSQRAYRMPILTTVSIGPRDDDYSTNRASVALCSSAEYNSL